MHLCISSKRKKSAPMNYTFFFFFWLGELIGFWTTELKNYFNSKLKDYIFTFFNSKLLSYLQCPPNIICLINISMYPRLNWTFNLQWNYLHWLKWKSIISISFNSQLNGMEYNSLKLGCQLSKIESLGNNIINKIRFMMGMYILSLITGTKSTK